MKKIKYILPLLLIFAMSCRAQVNSVSVIDLTVNNINIIGKDKSVLSQNFGLPLAIEQEFLEMDDVWADKYIYIDMFYSIVEDVIESFEISNSKYSFTTHDIRVGNNINTLEFVYPLSYNNRGSNFLTLNIDEYDYFITIVFDENTMIIRDISMGSY